MVFNLDKAIFSFTLICSKHFYYPIQIALEIYAVNIAIEISHVDTFLGVSPTYSKGISYRILVVFVFHTHTYVNHTH